MPFRSAPLLCALLTAASAASAHNTFLLAGRWFVAPGTNVALSLSSASTFPDFDHGPAPDRIVALTGRIGEEIVGRHLERKGLLERDLESSWLTLDSTDADDGMNALLGHSITYRFAAGPRAGQKAFA